MHASRFSSSLDPASLVRGEGPPEHPEERVLLRDLGTLFSAANGYLQIALLEMAADHPAQEALAVAGRVLWRAQNLSHGLASDDASGATQLRPLDLRRVAREAVQVAEGFAGPEVDLHVHVPQGPVGICGDAARLLRVVLDVIRHALDSTDAGRGSRIDVRVLGPSPQEPETATILVRDDGPGMSPDEVRDARRLLFGHVTHDGRTGLGLWLADRVAAQHGGGMQILSAPGAGTEVRFCLPSTVRP